jgi:hypothetical protein
MKIRTLTEVRAHLDEAFASLPTVPDDPAEAYPLFEELAGSILDASFGDYTDGLLETYLMVLCEAKMLEMGLVPDFKD